MAPGATDTRLAVRRVAPWLWRAAMCAVSVGCLAGAFYPFESAEGAWFGLAPMLVLARFTPPVSSFCWGWLAGFGFWLINLWWMLGLGSTGTSMPVAVLAWIALAAYSAVYNGLFLTLASDGFSRSNEPSQWRLAAGEESQDGEPEPGEPRTWRGRLRRMLLIAWLPVVWVGLEWVRSSVFTGFPWNTLGVSQFRFTAIIQIAAWGGVYAVSGLMVVMNTGLAIMAMRMVDLWRCRKITRFQVELAVSLLLFSACLVGGRNAFRREAAVEQNAERVSIMLIQPAIPQLKKWDESFFDEITNGLDRLTGLAARMKPDLLVWPETAIPLDRGVMESDWLPFVANYATGGVPVLAGVLEFVPVGDEGEFLCYNSSMLIDTNANIAGRYRKQHLVPFGEYIPTESWIRFLKRMAPLGFSCEPGAEASILRLEPSGHRFSVLICFEDIFPGLARAAVRRGAGFLVNQTNDAWFDNTPAPVQHMSHAVFRCVENRVAMVRVANTGVSCYIDRTGAIQKVGALQAAKWNLGASGFDPSTLAVRGDNEAPSFYTRWGDLGFAAPCAAACLAALALLARRVRRGSGTGI